MALTGVCVAPSDDWNTADPSWERIDSTYQVTGWTIDRGRVFEFDRTETGRATITLVDDTGAFDPTGGGAYADLTMRQAGIGLQNPDTGAWSTVFRGFVERVEWEPHQTMNFAFVRIYLVDALAILAAAEMTPDGTFGDSVLDGNIVFAEDTATNAVLTRIVNVLDQVGWPNTGTSISATREIFTGNVKLQQTVYAPRSPVLTVLQDAADAEFPGVANVYVQKDGKITFHGRLARFNPTDPQYHIAAWSLGDDAAAAVDPSNVVRISPPLLVSRDMFSLYTSAIATPQNVADADIPAQYLEDTAAVSTYGLRTWSAENLATLGGASSATALQVTALFADYIRDNYSEPRNRCGAITIRPQNPDGTYGPAAWALMCGVDISDTVTLTTSHVGGGGFAGETFFVEGVRYDAKPMSSTQHEITLTLDVSPASYYDSDPFA